MLELRIVSFYYLPISFISVLSLFVLYTFHQRNRISITIERLSNI
jgi:low temperature requirement protein LtrA